MHQVTDISLWESHMSTVSHLDCVQSVRRINKSVFSGLSLHFL